MLSLACRKSRCLVGEFQNQGDVVKILLSLFLCIGFLLNGGTGPALQANEGDIARVAHVVDGDSLVVERAGLSYQVRLWGIDSPEWGQRYSHGAKMLCRDLAEGRSVQIHEKDRDKYGRVVALVEINGRLLNEEMIHRGMAWVHIHYCNEGICAEWRKKQDEARAQGRGLWADRHPLAPWTWKSRKHKRQVNSAR